MQKVEEQKFMQRSVDMGCQVVVKDMKIFYNNFGSNVQ